MHDGSSRRFHGLDRRQLFKSVALAAAGCSPWAGDALAQAEAKPTPAETPPPAEAANVTRFQIACMTLPYAKFPLIRALQGIAAAGFQYVAWGLDHQENGGERVPVVPVDAPEAKAKELAQLCRDMKLNPIMMLSAVSPEQKDAVKLLTHRIKQAAAAGIPQVLTYGNARGGNRTIWIERLRQLGPIANDHNVTLVIKQHGDDPGSGKACAEIVTEIGQARVRVNYDAGNTLDHLNIDPVRDLKTCTEMVRSFSIKDHRKTPKSQDCGAGLGEIDHYKLLGLVAHTGQEMPLCCENVFAPLVPAPSKPEEIDQLASLSHQYLKLVTAGVKVAPST